MGGRKILISPRVINYMDISYKRTAVVGKIIPQDSFRQYARRVSGAKHLRLVSSVS